MYPGQTLKSANETCSAALTADGDFQITCVGDTAPRWSFSGVTGNCGAITFSTPHTMMTRAVDTVLLDVSNSNHSLRHAWSF